MIGVAGEDLLRSIELLEQHPACEKMGPGHRAQGQSGGSALEDRRCQTLRPAERKSELRRCAIAPRGEAIGQFSARPRSAALIEGDQWRAGRQGFQNQLGLARFEHRRRQPLSHFEFDDRGRRYQPGRVDRL